MLLILETNNFGFSSTAFQEEDLPIFFPQLATDVLDSLHCPTGCVFSMYHTSSFPSSGRFQYLITTLISLSALVFAEVFEFLFYPYVGLLVAPSKDWRPCHLQEVLH